MRIVGVLKENASRVALLLLFLLIFSWPYLSFLDRATPEALFSYFSIVWAVLIVVLWISNRPTDDNDNKKQ